MAAIKIDSSRGFDMRDLDFSNLYEGASYTTKSSLFAVHYSSGAVDEFRGSGFRYNSGGEPVGGTVHSYAFYYDGRLASVDGLNIAVTKIVNAAKTYSTSDDARIVKVALAGNDTFLGGNAADYANGFDGNDRISGRGGVDTLLGGNGSDVLNGGRDRDALTGGVGADTFVFSSASDSTKSAFDRISDFSRREHDHIDLSSIDANGASKGDKSFQFIGTHGFSDARGELRFETKNGNTIIQGDIDGDGNADLVISLHGRVDLHRTDFDF